MSRTWALLALCAGCFGGGSAEPVVEAVRGDFVATVRVEGELQAVEFATLRTPEVRGNQVITYLADHGSTVEEGEVVVAFATEELLAAQKEADRALLLAQTKLSQARARAELRETELRTGIQMATLDAELAAKMRTDSATVPAVEREAARVAEEKAHLAIDARTDELAKQKLDAASEQQLLRIEISQAEEQLVELEEQLALTELRAPTAGLALVQRNPRGGGRWIPGADAWRGAELVEIPDMTKVKAVIRVHEIDATGIEVGMPAAVMPAAYPAQPAAGVVSRVADLAVAREESPVKYLDVEVELTEMRPSLRPNMTADVEIELLRVPDVVSVPREAVFGDAEAPFVWRDGITGWDRTAVTLGATNATHVVVDLEQGTVVSLVDRRPAQEREETP